MKQSMHTPLLQKSLHLFFGLLAEPFRLTDGRLEKAPMFLSLLAVASWMIRLVWILAQDDAIYCFSAPTYRAAYSYSIYLFLPWNLFLAWLPFLIARYLRPDQSDWFFWPLMGLLLLFLPNAPYLLTDFIHFGEGYSAPFWMEFLVFGSFSAAGISLGSYALLHVHHCLEKRFDNGIAWGFTSLLLLLTSAGVFIGRIARFNSWDAFFRPLDLLEGIGKILTDPQEFIFFVIFSLICFCFLLLCYLLVYYRRQGSITN